MSYCSTSEEQITKFFLHSSATRQACDARARELGAGHTVVPVNVQGTCSYTVFTGAGVNSVVQYRLAPLSWSDHTSLAKQIYGSLVPTISFQGQIGNDDGDSANQSLFHALSWNQCVAPDLARRSRLAETYNRDLRRLLDGLPIRFQPIILKCIASLDDILSLPTVLSHQDLGVFNLLVNEHTGCLLGVIDWAEADFLPFGLNLYMLMWITAHLTLEHGWVRHTDYGHLEETFWHTFRQEAKGVTIETLHTIKMARILGVLLYQGFGGRSGPDANPGIVCNDTQRRNTLAMLDACLIEPTTRFDDIVHTA
ncbi:hypothetical protein ANO11243_045740 [Dothideomycetidae sp. 11243]|nr:hypothetical protein ANO11243_045740 [fungal sp. No.11243]